jgi:hypothetical protein
VRPNPLTHRSRAIRFFRLLRRVQGGRLGLDEDGAIVDPELVDDGLAELSGRIPRSLAEALCLSITDPAEAEDNILQLEGYVARYLHQPLPVIWEMTWHELAARFEGVVDMVRAENGKPPRGTFDPNQTFG